MGNYYGDKKILAYKISNLMNTNRGKKINLNDLELRFMIEFGFNKKMIIKVLEPYVNNGFCEIKGDEVNVYA